MPLSGQSDSQPEFSVRPTYGDDVIVRLRLRPKTLPLLRGGFACLHLRLDAVPGEDGLYDIYTETEQDLDGPVSAWEAKHSPGFVRHPDEKEIR
jgi:hypothetical protein